MTSGDQGKSDSIYILLSFIIIMIIYYYYLCHFLLCTNTVNMGPLMEDRIQALGLTVLWDPRDSHKPFKPLSDPKIKIRSDDTSSDIEL